MAEVRSLVGVGQIVMARLPVHTVMRLFVAVGLWVRLLSGYDQEFPTYTEPSALVTLVYTLYALYVTIGTWRLSSKGTPKAWYDFQVITDTVLITALYALTGRPHSDLYLLYFVPLLIAVEHFDAPKVVVSLGLVGVCFIGSLTFLNLSSGVVPATPFLETLVRNALPRLAFFIFFVLLTFGQVHGLRVSNEELQAVYETAVKASEDEHLQQRLDVILDASIRLLRAEGAKVYLKETDREQLKLVALSGVGLPEGFGIGSNLPIGAGIHGEVFRTAQPLIENDYPRSPFRIPEFSDRYESVLAVPLLIQFQPIGVLGVFNSKRRLGFTRQDALLLERLARYAAVAIKDSQHVSQLRRQDEASRSIISSSQALMNADMELDQILQLIVEHAYKLVEVYSGRAPLAGYIAILQSKSGTLEFKAAYPRNHLRKLQKRIGRLPVTGKHRGVISRAITTEATQNVRDVKNDPDYIELDSGTCSQLTVPISDRSRVIGVVSVEHPECCAFSGELQKNLEALTTQAGLAIVNANLMKEINSRRLQAERLQSAYVSISTAQDVRMVSDLILSSLRKIVPFERATLQLLEGDQRRILSRVNLPESRIDKWLLRPISKDKLINEIVTQKKASILTSTKRSPEWEPVTTTVDVNSWVGVPLVYRDEVLALITLDHVEEYFYSEEYRRPLDLFSRYAASVLQNALLLEQKADQISELTQTKEHLEALLNYFDEHQNLALIGLVYGETIHYAKSRLGSAKVKITDIAEGEYGEIPEGVSQATKEAIKAINEYLAVLSETQEQALRTPTPLPVNIHEILDRVVESKRLLSRSIEVTKDYNVVEPIVNAPERQLRQVFYVLIQNAIDAMPEGRGKLVLRTEIIQDTYPDAVMVSISDTGRGIDIRKQETLFEAKTNNEIERSHRGTGMGLFWARSFMRSYGGDITFETQRGKGTTMRVRIPQDFRGTAPRGIITVHQ